MEGCFNEGGRGGGGWGMVCLGGINFDGGFLKKIVGWGGGTPPTHYGKPRTLIYI